MPRGKRVTECSPRSKPVLYWFKTFKRFNPFNPSLIPPAAREKKQVGAGTIETNDFSQCSPARGSGFAGLRQGITGASATGSVFDENAVIDEFEDVTQRRILRALRNLRPFG